MRKQILMITSTNDLTCDYLTNAYSGVSFYRLNFDEFSKYSIGVDESGFQIDSSEKSINSQSCLSIYYRKPVVEDLDGIFEEKYHSFVHKESYSLVEGIAESFHGRCLTRPSVMRRANNKVVQLILAREIGFKLPSSSITNCPSNIASVGKGNKIVKPLAVGTIVSDGVKEFVQTNVLDECVSTEYLKYSPAYFQEYISKDYEVRSTFVNGEEFSVKILSENKVDWRKANNNISYDLMQLPSDIYNMCVVFMKKLDMSFGCFDFIVRNGEFYFLEMNANGQWAWLEKELGVQISRALVGYLSA
ncbi:MULTISPECIES: MvdC/MvdD family ATP grasp protein [unclassified Pseudomonas]|uniref:MvdC/MvdD family ATP grasp protein n=1 Tax=unclassified Pseudomonas TaxID=196821 RepID=UPI001F36D6A4|nr:MULTISPECIES: hypothetical protein [unclassified Pseudomonas]